MAHSLGKLQISTVVFLKISLRDNSHIPAEMGELKKDKESMKDLKGKKKSICRLLLSGLLWVRIMKNRPFVLKPPLENLFLEATWCSQHLGCGCEEFALGVSALFWHPVAGFPQGSSLSCPSEESNAYPWQQQGLGTPGKVVLETNSHCQWLNGLQLICSAAQGVCSFLQQPGAQQSRSTRCARAKKPICTYRETPSGTI